MQEAEMALDEFSQKWDKQYLSISQMWFNHWGNANKTFLNSRFYFL